MTSTTSRTNRYKFRVYHQNTHNYIAFQSNLVNQSYQFPIRLKGTHKVKVEHTHRSHNEGEHKSTYKKTENKAKPAITTNIIGCNGCWETHIKTQKEEI